MKPSKKPLALPELRTQLDCPDPLSLTDDISGFSASATCIFCLEARNERLNFLIYNLLNLEHMLH